MDQLFTLGVACIIGWIGLKHTIGAARQTPGVWPIITGLLQLAKNLVRTTWWFFRLGIAVIRRASGHTCLFICNRYFTPHTPIWHQWRRVGTNWVRRRLLPNW